MRRFLVDENIPQAREALGGLGEVELRAGRSITAEDVRDVEALIVRSVTRVGRELLEGSRVRFVGTATTGTDHVDEGWLASHGIGFASAAGSNARSVVEYVVAALLETGARGTLGIVGYGRIGSQVARMACVLGMDVVACDPPLARAGGRDALGNPFERLEEVLGRADVVTVHVPLVRDGEDCTVGLLDGGRLGLMNRGARLINTSRGDVVDEEALLRLVRSGALAPPVLDVWAGEPAISQGMLDAAALATPHIAGYSLDGKLEGTRMVAAAAARHFGVAYDWRPRIDPPAHRVPAAGDVRELVRAAYAIREDDARLRGAIEGESLAARFDRLRRTYPVRREFAAFEVAGGAGAAPPAHELGFARR